LPGHTALKKEMNFMPKKSKTKGANKRVKVQDLASKTKKLTAEEEKNIEGGLAIDPSDPTGNTYISSASGGVWKTTNVKPVSK
jgi:hypothetical protein